MDQDLLVAAVTPASSRLLGGPAPAALWAMERQFRRVKQYRHLPLLKQALHRTLSPTHSAAA